MFYQVLILFLCWSSFLVAQEPPQQVHLSLGADATQMVVTWVTMHTSPNPIVKYGETGLTHEVKAQTTRFVDGGSEQRHMYIHRAILTGLKPANSYLYQCGEEAYLSKTYKFKTITDDTNWSPRLAVYGDMGADNAQSVPRLTQDINKGLYDVILHIGDFAYDMDSDNARVGDKFMNIIEPIAAQVPYQVCPGNHEHRYNFSNYNNRFTMIDQKTGQINNFFYSFDLGTAHIISISSEFYYYTEYGWDQIRHQFEWLENDLKEATKKENRDKRPWIIFMSHKSMYCQTNDELCSQIDATAYQRHRLRKGIKMRGVGELLYGLEDMLHKYEVDLQLYGHEHNYQRYFPVYDNHVFNGTKSNPYHNPTVPVVIITGSAGCRENHAKFRTTVPSWSALRNSDYGYSRMTIHNKTHISFEQVSDDQAGKIIDSIVIIKDRTNFESDNEIEIN